MAEQPGEKPDIELLSTSDHCKTALGHMPKLVIAIPDLIAIPFSDYAG
jgi:hypothetical protein